jgi:hypothetical protein
VQFVGSAAVADLGTAWAEHVHAVTSVEAAAAAVPVVRMSQEDGCVLRVQHHGIAWTDGDQEVLAVGIADAGHPATSDDRSGVGLKGAPHGSGSRANLPRGIVAGARRCPVSFFLPSNAGREGMRSSSATGFVRSVPHLAHANVFTPR